MNKPRVFGEVHVVAPRVIVSGVDMGWVEVSFLIYVKPWADTVPFSFFPVVVFFDLF